MDPPVTPLQGTTGEGKVAKSKRRKKRQNLERSSRELRSTKLPKAEPSNSGSVLPKREIRLPSRFRTEEPGIMHPEVREEKKKKKKKKDGGRVAKREEEVVVIESSLKRGKKRKRRVTVPEEDGPREKKLEEVDEERRERNRQVWSARRVPDNIMSRLQWGPKVQCGAPGSSGRSSPLTPLPDERDPAAPLPTPHDPAARAPRRKPGRRPKIPPTVPATPAVIHPVPTQVKGIRSSTFARVLRLVCDHPAFTSLPPKPVHKEALRAKPPVWAETRQELCEALPYYRAFQSGLYMNGGVPFGYLLDAFGAPRDIWADGGRVIISHGGGQCARVLDTSGRPIVCLQADQSPDDARVDALLQAAKHRTPVVLIAGQGYDLLPWRMGMAYVVLGWYWVSAAWVETEYPPPAVKAGRKGYYHRVKIRFDWVDCQGPPWWTRQEEGRRSLTPLPHSPVPIPPAQASPVDVRGQGVMEIHGLLTPESTPPRKPLDFAPLSPSTNKPSVRSLLAPAWISMIAQHQAWTHDIEETEELELEALREDPFASTCDDHRESGARVVAEGSTKSPSVHATRTCSTCRRPSIELYAEGWICLRPRCPAFWMLNTPLGLLPIPPGFRLSYHPNFLVASKTLAEVRAPYDILPTPPSISCSDAPTVSGGLEGSGSRVLWRGWVCDDCGRANCRYRWEVWQCRYCNKQLSHLQTAAIASPLDLTPLHPPLLGDAKLDPSSGVITEMRLLPSLGAIGMVYHIPSGGGTIYHILRSSPTHVEGLFETYQLAANQTSEPLFQRRALKNATIKGQMLSQQFAVNSGASYKYIVDTLSVPFDESPPCVWGALDVISTTVAHVLGEQIAFNEVLSVMYREGQKMSWHDDGEKGLGPIVSSLSLGAPATMSWRPKTARIQPNQTFSKGHDPSRKHTLPDITLTITLSHGDIVIMQGREMQEQYNHRVLPQGLRVAATARVIST